MADTEIKVDKTTGEVIEIHGDSPKYTLDYALEQLEKVRSESLAFAVETREKLIRIESHPAGDFGAQFAGEALGVLVREQEEIYRRLTDFYIGMIADLKEDTPPKKRPAAVP